MELGGSWDRHDPRLLRQQPAECDLRRRRAFAIRDGLDAAGHTDTLILAYAAKFASGFYGPFREAVASSLRGDRRTYQQDAANAREAVHEIELDIDEGADIIMVKPAMAYLDLVRAAADISPVPVAARMKFALM